MRIVYRNLNDLDEVIRAYEKRYGISSVEMLKDSSVRSKINEDELLKWEAYLTQRRRLLDHNAEVHQHYLSQQTASTSKKRAATYDPATYAA
jgi:hypothetical protein